MHELNDHCLIIQFNYTINIPIDMQRLHPLNILVYDFLDKLSSLTL